MLFTNKHNRWCLSNLIELHFSGFWPVKFWWSLSMFHWFIWTFRPFTKYHSLPCFGVFWINFNTWQLLNSSWSCQLHQMFFKYWLSHAARNWERERDWEAMGYHILCRIVHITQWKGIGLDTIGFHTQFSIPVPGPCTGSVQCEWAILGGRRV